MSLQFIFGNSGSGKSRYLYEQVIAGACENPNRNYIVLVPEQFTMQTQKELVRLHPRHGIMNIDVLSFGRLAHRIFEEVGGNRRIVLDDIGKSLLLRKAAGDMEGELKVLGSNIRRLGYISEVKSVISEFTQYDVGAEELERVMEVERSARSFTGSFTISRNFRKNSESICRENILPEKNCWMSLVLSCSSQRF